MGFFDTGLGFVLHAAGFVCIGAHGWFGGGAIFLASGRGALGGLAVVEEFVGGRDIAAEVDALGEKEIALGGFQCGELDVLLAAFVFLDSIENFRGDRGGDAASGLRALDKNHDDILGVFEGGERDEPGVVVFHSGAPELGGSGFSSGGHLGIFGAACGAATLVHDAPHTLADMVDLGGGEAGIGEKI